MAITRKQKEEILAGVEASIKDAGSLVFVNFKGLTVADTTAMRRGLRAKGVGYKVAKKTLIGKALDAKGYAGDKPAFPGELAVAYSTDMLAPAREVSDFAKKYKEKLTILGGVFENTYKNTAEMAVIAAIPDRQTLYAQLAMLLNSPLQQLAVAMSEIAKKKETA